MKSRYTETALAEVNEIFAYISERSPTAAKRVVARVERTVRNLGNFPEMAQESDQEGSDVYQSAVIRSSSSIRSTLMRS
jgi:plasmid stabilization system protein ParE